MWVGAGAMRLALLWLPGHTVDLTAFHGWALRLAETGPRSFYDSGVFVDYLPGYLLVLWPLGLLLQKFPDLAPQVLKLPPTVADFAVAHLLHRLGGPRGALAASAYLWNPAVLLAGPWWGQVESVAIAWLLGSFWTWQKSKLGWAGLLFGLGALTKPQYALVGGLLLLGVAQGWPGWRAVGAAAAGCVAGVVGCGLVFGLAPWDLVRLGLQASATYPYGSVNALNFWYLFGLNWRPDATPVLGLPAVVWGAGLSLTLAAWAGRRMAGSNDVGLSALGACAVSVATFSLATRMHERYLFPAVPLALLAWSRERAPAGLWIAISGILLGNLLYGLGYLASFPEYRTLGWAAVWRMFVPPVPQALCVASLLAAAWSGWHLTRSTRGG